MAKTDEKAVDAYIAGKPEKVRGVLLRVRQILRKALPGAEEVISYQIPAYKVNGRAAIYFAGWKEHYSLYPATGGVAETFAAELSRYEVSKGTIRFPFSEPVPARLIERIAKLRAKLTLELAAAKARKRPAARKKAAGARAGRAAQKQPSTRRRKGRRATRP